MAKKSYNQKLHPSTNLPRIEEINDPKAIASYGGSKMLIAPPLAYDSLMRLIPLGMLTTYEALRKHLATQAGADFTCPLTAGIFINIVAGASAEREAEGSSDLVPYWRTLKKNGELNEKYPDGIEGQKHILQQEGHVVVQRGKRYFVQEFQEKLCDLSANI